ncbi:hypothetical protein EPN96_03015 [bacterium]|nr:MAG: hypothetical protein EPN96_03015 [bacterium]
MSDERILGSRTKRFSGTLIVLILLFSPNARAEVIAKTHELYCGVQLFTSGRESAYVNNEKEGRWSESGSAAFGPAPVIGWRGSFLYDGGAFITDLGSLHADAGWARVSGFTLSLDLARRFTGGGFGLKTRGFEQSLGGGLLVGMGNVHVEDESDPSNRISVAGEIIGLDLFADTRYRLGEGRAITLRYKLIPAWAYYYDYLKDKEGKAFFVAHAFTIGYVF